MRNARGGMKPRMNTNEHKFFKSSDRHALFYARRYILDMELKEQQTPWMDEVRVKLKLSNGSDRLLAKTGALDTSRIRTCQVDALVDTGAVRSVIPRSVAKELWVAGRSVQNGCLRGRSDRISAAGWTSRFRY